MNKLIMPLLFGILTSTTFSAESVKDLKPDDQKPIYHDMICDVAVPELDCYGNIVTRMTKRFVIPANLTGPEREALLDQIAIEQKRAEEARQKLGHQNQQLKELFKPDKKVDLFGGFEGTTKSSQDELLNFLRSTGHSFLDVDKKESEKFRLGQIADLSSLSEAIQTCCENEEFSKLELDLSDTVKTKLEIIHSFEEKTNAE